MARPLVYVCAGKDCRKRKRARRDLLEALEGHASVREVRCQKVCDGPVCGVAVGGALEWFGSVDDEKTRSALLELIDGRLQRPLEKRRVKKRRNKLRT